MDVKKLSVVVEQKGIAPTAKNLNSLAKAAEGAQQPLERLSSTLGSFKSVNLDKFSGNLQETSQAIKDVKASTQGLAEMAKNITGLSVNLTNIANATERLSAKTSDVAAYVTQLRAMKVELEGMKGLSGSLSGVKTGGTSGTSGSGRVSNVDAETKAQARLAQQIERTAMMAGRTKSEYLALRAAQAGLSESMVPHIARIKQYETNTNGATMSTKAYNAALRMVPAQFTDIATQLAGGQNPMLILMQQGGQLKDMFGGVGGALKAVGKELAKTLANPLVLVAAAFATVTYAIYKSSTELDAFNKAIITTNGISGITTNAFYSMRDSLSAVSGTKSQATEAMTAIAASGKIASENVYAVGVAAVQMNKVTGQAVSDTVKEFELLGGKPSEEITKLNDKYKFLTASVYDQIVALEKQGKIAEASAIATKAYEDAIAKMAGESNEKLGWVLRGWEAIKKAVIGVKDEILDLGVANAKKQMDGLETSIYSVQQTLDAMQNNNVDGILGKSKSDWQAELASLQSRRNAIVANMAAEDSAAQQRKESVETEQKLIKSREKFGDITSKYQSKEAQKQKEINELKKAYNGLANATPKDTEDYNKSMSEIEAKYKQTPDRSAERAQKKFDASAKEVAAIEGVIASLKNENASIEANGLAYDKVNEHTKAAIKWKLQAATSGVSEEAKAHATKMAAYEDEAAYQQTIKTDLLANIKSTETYNELVRKNAQEVSDLSSLYEQEQKYITMTTKEKTAAQALYANEVAMNKELLALEAQRKNVRTSTQAENLEASMANTRAAYAEKAALINANLALQEKELTWMENLTVATGQYKDNLGTYNAQMQSGMLSVFSTVESALTNFVSGTKSSFKDLAVSVLKQIAVMLAKIAIMKAAMAVVGMVSGSASATPTTTPGYSAGDLGSGLKLNNAKGNAFTGSGIAKFAKGSAFTNSVVTRPTTFAFASGGAFNNGLMGEAGPEAVMPLTRTANGNLGVETSGTGGTQNNIAVNVTMNSNGTSTTNTQSDDQNNAKAMGDLIARKVKEVIQQEQRPSGLLATR